MNKPIINIDELEFQDFGKGDKFQAGRAEVSRRIGATKLGYGVVRLQPGKRAWPFHSHYVIEEFFYILQGEYTVQFPDTGEVEVGRAGQVIQMNGPQWHSG